MENFYEFEEQYRDHIATVDSQGKRIWMYPKKPSGSLHNKRVIVTIILLAILFAGPFIKIGGHPLLLMNFFERKFVILGIPFWPQDLHIFAIATITFFVFIILFTVVFGRIWCGWACPQTLFMEMVFRKIDYWIEGDANQQRKLDAMPWNSEKIRKKGLKFTLYLLISILIAHTLMAYLIGIDQVKVIVSQPPTEHLAGFIGLVFFTGIFFWVFAYFREQACTVVCPYGRLQGVLLNKESIAVMYDWIRGEPRGKMKKNQVQEDKGDCIDCKLCVHACPTGIDIRNGTQLECVNCTACIDACDDVMRKIHKPEGLIRYSSHDAIEHGKEKLLTTRVAGYSVVLVILMTLLGFLLMTRSDVEATIVRVPGQLYQKTEDGGYSNLYNIQFANKTYSDVEIVVKVGDGLGTIEKVGGGPIIVPENGTIKHTFFVKIPANVLTGYKTELIFEFYNGVGELITDKKTNFLGPATVAK